MLLMFRLGLFYVFINILFDNNNIKVDINKEEEKMLKYFN